MTTRTLHPTEVPACQAILATALARKHPHLSNEEFQQVQRAFQLAHWEPGIRFGQLSSRMSYDSRIQKHADPILRAYLKTAGITILPKVAPSPLHPYTHHKASGWQALQVVERKAVLNRKLKALKSANSETSIPTIPQE